MIVWNLSAIITYTNGDWEAATLYKNEKNDFIQIGPDISTLPIINDFMTKLGLFMRVGNFYRNDIKDATYSFSAISTDSKDNVRALGTTNLIDIISDDPTVIKNDLLSDKEFINDLAADFRLVWDTRLTSSGSSDSNQASLPLESSGTYDFTVDWGDGKIDTITAYSSPSKTHTYAQSGQYNIIIRGTCKGWRFNNTGDRLKLLRIDSFGPLFALGNNASYFYGCANLTEVGKDLINIGSLTRVFTDCFTFIGDNLAYWDTSNCTSLAYAFNNCYVFNGDISGWNTSKVGSLGYAFRSAAKFARNIGSWDVSNVSSMFYAFRSAVAFNNDITNWNTAKMSNTYNMFYGATKFNQDLSRWTVKSATSLGVMFNGSALSTENYSRILIGWANDVYSRGGYPINIGFDSGKAYNNVVYGGSPYNNAVSARAYLVSRGWTITDLGLVP